MVVGVIGGSAVEVDKGPLLVVLGGTLVMDGVSIRKKHLNIFKM